ncbi:hypothetical protein KKC08_03075 [Patescibacteria group bacterium]|nr:hypothetical protein [Patescibacteria group bacterium]MCG2702480.1 hypothetical protein [Candidatus Parcubacteria bacterium]MBU4264912.1 hypothetical protein [Patescibacteria group bacterium]MBU4389661.1 hypothetical protein [Patescibacteria group bacterium]MBU4397121.1 hypothetical protein [Patescibacteria group bacterium]
MILIIKQMRNNIKNKLEKIYCLSVLMGIKNLQTIHPYVIKNHRLFAKEIQNQLKLNECVILSKCNCIEIYYVSSMDHRAEIVNLWKKRSGKSTSFKSKNIFEYSGKKVIKHLFETACGLKSVTLGDNQVVGQVRQAINVALEDKTAGTILKIIFNNARKVSNTVRNTTNIGKGNVSTERTAVDMMLEKSIPKDSCILIIGAGSTGNLLCKILNENGYINLVMVNRTIAKAKKLLKNKLIKKIFALNSIQKLAIKPTVVFFATPKIFKKSQLKFLNNSKHALIFDLGIPQNTLLVKTLYEIYNLKSINEFSLHNKKLRKDSILIAKDIISIHITKTIDAMIFRLKEDTRRKHFHTNNEVYKSKIPNIKIKSNVYFVVRQTLINLGFTEVHTPMITAVATDPVRNDPEEEIFSVNWYGKKMFLRQSNQLYKQILVLSGVDKLFELGPFWRAEQNPTPRHLSEAYGLDIEIAGVKNLNELIFLLQKLLHEITENLFQDGKISKNHVISNEIKIITYNEALDILNSKYPKNKIGYGVNFGYKLEQKLGKIIFDEYKTDLFAITKYPRSIKKFYTKRTKEDKTLSFDVIYKGWEIVSGAIRETNYKKLLKGIKETGLRYKKYQFYLDAFKNPVPHGGFCLGIDRFLVKLLNLNGLSDIFSLN